MLRRVALPQRSHHQWGRADFFDNRRKSIFFRIAGLDPKDVLYDLGCGDASLLIYAVRKANLEKAVGFEHMPSRARRARERIREAGFQERIDIEDDMYDAELTKADVIFDMLPEGRNDYAWLYGRKRRIRAGTRIIKHDLPLVGFLATKVDYPFYLMEFPLVKASTRREWARNMMLEDDAIPEDVWNELLYYGNEKYYVTEDIRRFESMLRVRVRSA